MERVKIGLVGFGTVGSSLYQLLEANGQRFARRLGVRIEVAKIGVKDTKKKRPFAPPGRFVQGYSEIIADAEIPIVVELVGGVDVAHDVIRSALLARKHVITANKALLSLYGNELFRLARRQGVELKFEASVCGGIPIIKVIRESLLGNRIKRILGIVNGTTNYILTRMSEEAKSFQEALREAQSQGFAETDPTLDVEGIDASQKISLLASIAFGQWVDYRQVLSEGISGITEKEIQFAKFAGFTFKLIAAAEWLDGRPAVTVFPALLPQEHPLAAIRGENNAVYVDTDFLGTSVYAGKGAGGPPTASAVASDVGDLVQHIVLGSKSNRDKLEPFLQGELYPHQEISYRYFFHFITANRPGIWATVTGRLAENGINIESVHQKWEDKSKPSDLYILVDPAKERQAGKAMREITAAEGISDRSVFYRILLL